MKDTLSQWTATIAAIAAWTYFGSVLLLGRSLGGIYVGPTEVILGLPLVTIAAWLLSGLAVARGRGATVLRMSVVVSVTIVSLVVADIIFTARLDARTFGRPNLSQSRLYDPEPALGELLPHLYYPTELNFRLHKANVSLSGAAYGGFYSPELLESPTLAKAFVKHRFSWTIDSHGFRNTIPLGSAEIFALGDSFTFGWAVDADTSWVGRLQTELDRPIYNLGVHDGSPKQELELLEYMFRAQADSMHVRRLLWLIYEGNDLEDSYAERAPQPEVHSPGCVERFPWFIRNHAILHRLLSGELSLRAHDEGPDPSRFVVDGVASWYPLYDSEVFGPRLFQPTHLEHLAQPASYVRDHPNRPRLDAVFDEMASLAAEHSFEVVVIIAPTSGRVHGPYFEGFPTLSEKPWFINYVAELAQTEGFQVVNLLPHLQPYAGRELLYFRDDDHWNARGHALVAEIIRSEVFP